MHRNTPQLTSAHLYLIWCIGSPSICNDSSDTPHKDIYLLILGDWRIICIHYEASNHKPSSEMRLDDTSSSIFRFMMIIHQIGNRQDLIQWDSESLRSWDFKLPVNLVAISRNSSLFFNTQNPSQRYPCLSQSQSPHWKIKLSLKIVTVFILKFTYYHPVLVDDRRPCHIQTSLNIVNLRHP